MEEIIYTIPNWALSALINGDATSLTDEEEEILNDFTDAVISEHGHAIFVYIGDVGLVHRNDMDNLAGECSECSLLV